MPRALGDFDPGQVRVNLSRMAAIHERYPDIVLMPAHDARGFAALPKLPIR